MKAIGSYVDDAYGRQTITSADGVTRTKSQSSVGFDRGFTGYGLDGETGLYYARARMYSSGLGRFVGRDPIGYIDGMSLFSAYFCPNYKDPLGFAVASYNWVVPDPTPETVSREVTDSRRTTPVGTQHVTGETYQWNDSTKCCCKVGLARDITGSDSTWQEQDYHRDYNLILKITVDGEPDTVSELGEWLGLTGEILGGVAHVGEGAGEKYGSHGFGRTTAIVGVGFTIAGIVARHHGDVNLRVTDVELIDRAFVREEAFGSPHTRAEFSSVDSDTTRTPGECYKIDYAQCYRQKTQGDRAFVNSYMQAMAALRAMSHATTNGGLSHF